MNFTLHGLQFQRFAPLVEYGVGELEELSAIAFRLEFEAFVVLVDPLRRLFGKPSGGVRRPKEKLLINYFYLVFTLDNKAPGAVSTGRHNPGWLSEDSESVRIILGKSNYREI